MADSRDVFAFGKYIVPGSLTIAYFVYLILPTFRFSSDKDFFSQGLSLDQLGILSQIIIGILGAGYTVGFVMYIVYTHFEDEQLREDTYAMKYLKQNENFKEMDYEDRLAFYDLICYSKINNINSEEKIEIERYVNLIKGQWDYLHSTFVIGKYSPLVAFGTFIFYLLFIRPETCKDLIVTLFYCWNFSFWKFYIGFVIIVILLWKFIFDKRLKQNKKNIDTYQEIVINIRKEAINNELQKYKPNSPQPLNRENKVNHSQ